MPKIIFTVLPATLLCFGTYYAAVAQAPVAQSDQMTQGGEIIQGGDSSVGKFESVEVDPSATPDVALHFPVSLANKSVVVEALDGGRGSATEAHPRSERTGRFPSRSKLMTSPECRGWS